MFNNYQDNIDTYLDQILFLLINQKKLKVCHKREKRSLGFEKMYFYLSG